MKTILSQDGHEVPDRYPSNLDPGGLRQGFERRRDLSHRASRQTEVTPSRGGQRSPVPGPVTGADAGAGPPTERTSAHAFADPRRHGVGENVVIPAETSIHPSASTRSPRFAKPRAGVARNRRRLHWQVRGPRQEVRREQPRGPHDDRWSRRTPWRDDRLSSDDCPATHGLPTGSPYGLVLARGSDLLFRVRDSRPGSGRTR